MLEQPSDDPGLVLDEDGVVWLVAADGTRTQLGGGTITTPLTIALPASAPPTNELLLTHDDVPGGKWEFDLQDNGGGNGTARCIGKARGTSTAALRLLDNTGTVANDGLVNLTSAEGLYLAPRAGSPTALEIADTVTGDDVFVVNANGDVGFFGAPAAGKPTVTGAKLPGDDALTSLLAGLVALGLVTDSTT